MTVAALAATIDYIEDGVTLAFPAPFRFLAATDLVVTRITSSGVATLAYGSEWNATGGTTDSGGTVNLLSTVAGARLRITRRTPRAQTTNYTTADTFPAETHEGALDRSMLIDQEQDVAILEALNRAIKVPEGETGGTLAAASLRKGRYLGFDYATGAATLFDAPTIATVANSVVSTMAALTAIIAPAAGQSALLTETGRVGTWVFSSANLSGQVTSDVGKGLFAAPDAAPSGAAGAWVRKVLPGKRFEASWFGLPSGGDDSAIVRSIEALKEDGRDVKFAAGTFKWNDLRINKAGHWGGVGKATVVENNGAGVYNSFGVATSGGTRISHMRFTGLYDADNADAQFHINVSPRVNVVTVAETMEDFEFDHLFFDLSDTGIRVSFGGTGPTNDVAGTTWWTPSFVHIHDCRFEDVLYQPIIPEGHNILIENCYFKLSVKPGGGYRPFSYSLRILGCNRVTVRNNQFDVPYDYPVISTQLAGVDNGLANVAFRTARNVTIEGNRSSGGFFLIYHSADRLSIRNNWFWNNPESTTDVPPALFYLAFQQGQPIYLGNVEIHDNIGYGYPVQLFIENNSADKISYKRNTIYGNKKTGAAFDIMPIKVIVNNGVFNQDGVTQIKPPCLLEIEGNGIHANPSMIGSFMQVQGYCAGLHLSVAGNITSERQGAGTTLISASALTGDFKVSLGFASKFDSWATVSGAVDLSDDVVGDNRAMPTGFYAEAMLASKFRAEQIVSTVYPPIYA
ncbi:right-handed parallel beta-helix repeat-containing protein [Novosphingobium sp.]|uniref:right-handed parallel beta-helix repeat-containing protein n=1 Tax=Novosphingobium sp. TaxID=1874826 RepID=UPI00286D6B79|nr:right-handed parallel beta-helix repeat-containing protein [Novosphingobium sp.]